MPFRHGRAGLIPSIEFKKLPVSEQPPEFKGLLKGTRVQYIFLTFADNVKYTRLSLPDGD
jgi:hypothetical protein